MVCYWTILDSVIISISSIQMCLVKRILLTHTYLCILPRPSCWHRQRRNIILYTNRDDFNFLIVIFVFINSNILVARTYGAQLQPQQLLKQDMLLQDWSHRFTISRVDITNRMSVMKYPVLRWQWIFSILRRMFFFPLSPSSICDWWPLLTVPLYLPFSIAPSMLHLCSISQLITLSEQFLNKNNCETIHGSQKFGLKWVTCFSYKIYYE
jgi:hypothetical protein